MSGPVLVINRAPDNQRLACFDRSAKAFGIDYEIISAVDSWQADFPAPDQAAFVGSQFWGSDKVKPGALACFLSHRAAWLTLIAADAPAGLVCEDDIEFTSVLGPAYDLLADFDVLFCNQRLAQWALASGTDTDTVTIGQLLAGLSSKGGVSSIEGLRPAPGGDCYLVSRRGAKRLLSLLERDGVFCGVDWAMIWYGLDGTETVPRDAAPEIGRLETAMGPPTQELRVGVCARPVSCQTGEHPSTLRHEHLVPLAEIRARARR